MIPGLPPLTAGNPLLPPVRPSLDFPELEVETPLWPYDDLNIKGQYNRWPQIPGDIIPTASILIGPGDDKPHAAQFTKDRRLKVDAFISGGSAGGGSVVPIAMQDNTATYEAGANVSNPSAFLQIPANMRYLYSISGAVIVQGDAPPTNQGINFRLGIGGGGGFGILLNLWSDMVYSNAAAPFVEPHRLPVDWEPCAPLDLWNSLDNSGNWWMTLAWTDNPHITRVDFTTAWVWGA